MDDDAVGAILASHLRIQVLKLKGLKKVTDEGIMDHLVDTRQSHILREVHLRGTSCTWRGIVQLTQKRPGLHIPALD